LKRKNSIYENKISKQIFILSILFFYIPTLIIGSIYIVLFRNEELKVNVSVVQKTAKILETILYDKKLESMSLTKYIAISDDLNNNLKNKNHEKLDETMKEYAKEYNLDNIFIFDKECKIIYQLNESKDNYYFYCYLSPNSETIFFYDRIFFDTIVPIGAKDNSFYVYTRSSFKNSEIKNLLIKDIDFSIVEKNSGIRVFSTFDKPQEESKMSKSVGSNTIIKLYKKKFFYKYFGFTTNEKMKNFLMEVVVSPEFYRIRVDKIGYLSITLFIFWILATFLFFLIANKLLVIPIRKILIVADDITRGNYKMRLEVKDKNEIGTLARKFNAMANSLQLKETQLNNINKKLEAQVNHRTKSLQTAIDKLRNYDNQKSDMFYTVIHDLKNPMTVVSGYANFLLQYKNATEDKKNEILTKIANESERLTKMLNEFLKNIREENSLADIELKPIDISEILEYFYTVYEIQAKERLIDFVWNVQSPLPKINGNKEKIEHVISNLLSNAFKFTPERGMIKISGRVEGESIKIIISDTGPGVKSGYEKEIFEKFKKFETDTNDNKQGSGLGLYIVSEIIKLHNGNIWVTNNQSGIGCSFCFTLPIIHS